MNLALKLSKLRKKRVSPRAPRRPLRMVLLEELDRNPYPRARLISYYEAQRGRQEVIRELDAMQHEGLIKGRYAEGEREGQHGNDWIQITGPGKHALYLFRKEREPAKPVM